MLFKNKELKAMARARLSGRWKIFIGVCALYEGASILSSYLVAWLFPTDGGVSQFIISEVASLIVSILLSILYLGVLKIFLDGARGQETAFRDIIYGFTHNPDRTIILQLLLNIFYYVLYYPFSLASSDYLEQTMTNPGTLPGPVWYLTAAAALAYLYFSLCYSQAMILLADFQDITPVQAMRESRRLMRGRKKKYFLLELSFIGVSILGVLTLGAAFLWVFPYLWMTRVQFYRMVTGEIVRRPANEPFPGTPEYADRRRREP